ncbi:MAG: thiamine phosphate synthase [Myxococcota bacterium]
MRSVAPEVEGLYGIADSAFGDPLAQARLLADEGVAIVQLRCKGWSTAGRIALARVCPPVCLVINDDVDAARAVGAWAHLGQEDGPDPAGTTFGRSTHSVAQAASPGAAAYVGFGPVFATDTKDTGYDARGLDLLAEVVRVSPVPVVAIGGVTPARLDALRATGVHAWTAIGAVWTAPDPRAAIRALRARS